MKLGTEVLRQVVTAFDRIEEQFETIKWVDDQLSKEDGVYEFMQSLVNKLVFMTKSQNGYLLVRKDGVRRLVSVIHVNDAKAQQLLALLPVEDSGSNTKVSSDSQSAFFYSFVKVPEVPAFCVALEDAYLGRELIRYEESAFISAISLIIHRAKSVLSKKVSDQRAALLSDLSTNFLLPTREGESTEFEAFEQRPASWVDGRWRALLSAILVNLPKWGPFSFGESLPRIQLLTVEETRDYLRLRANLPASETELEASSLGMRPIDRLQRSRTVCGILLDAEDKGDLPDHLRVNPATEKRYASYLFETEIPKSELIVPLRVRGRIIAMINLEHREEDAFSDFHIASVVEIGPLITEFVAYLLSDERIATTIEKEFRYVLMRLIKRISHTQEHRLKTDYSDLTTSLKYLSRAIPKKVRDERILEELQNAETSVLNLNHISLKFSEDLTALIAFGKKDLRRTLQQAVDDLKLGVISRDDNVDFILDAPGDEVNVFCSDLAREHIFNIVNNSYEQIRKLREEDPNFNGKISIKLGKKAGQDNKGNTTTYDLAVITVTDNAGGVPPEVLHRIFNVGFTTKERTGGTGFGLPAARDYMRSIGGELHFENQHPKGATVVLMFPIYSGALHDAMIGLLNINIPD